MTLHDAGLWFRMFGAFVGVCLVARAAYPLFVERSRQRDVDNERASVDEYIESLERNGSRLR
jgi:hypothetical protein